MDLNLICIGLLCIPILYGFYTYYTFSEFVKPVLPVSLWGEQVGRSKLIQSKTGDASLFIEKNRRNVTKNGGFGPNNMTGAIDYFCITRSCPCPIFQPCSCVCCEDTDGGNSTDILHGIYDGGGAKTEFSNCNIDGGNVIHGQTCECCPVVDGGNTSQSDYIYDGGGTITNFIGSNMDGGSA